MLLLVFAPVIAIREIAFARNAFLFRRPFAQVYKLTAFAAEWAKWTHFSPDDSFPTGWAVYGGYVRHRHSLTTGQFKIEAFRHGAMFTVQRHKADRETAFMSGNLRVKLLAKRQIQAQKIGVVAVILIETVETGLLAERGRVTHKIEDQG